MKKKRVVSYLRVSSMSQIDNTSIEDQREKIDLFCRLNNYELVKEFVDEAKSAKSIEPREEYNKMIEFIDEGANDINAIVVYKSDRIHRRLKNLMIMIDHLQELSIDFISITEQFDTSTPQGLLFLQMLGSFAEFERKQIAERTRSGRLATAKKELIPGSKPPFGYKIVDNKFHIVEEEAIIIKKIFKMRCAKKSLSEIGKEFGMSKQRIDYILKNKIYIGEFNYNGKVEQNNIILRVEPIISKYMFNKANLINRL